MCLFLGKAMWRGPAPLADNDLTALTVEAIKAQQGQIEELKRENAELRKALGEVRRMVEGKNATAVR